MHWLAAPAVRLVGLSLAALALAAAPVGADVTSSASVKVRVEVHARTVLQVSTRQLQFDVSADQGSATAALDFRAAARTRRGAEVVLTIEPERWVEGPGGAADVEAEVSFTGDGPGTMGGILAPNVAATVGRWIGSGARSGRLLLTLRAIAPGSYHLPVRLVLSAP